MTYHVSLGAVSFDASAALPKAPTTPKAPSSSWIDQAVVTTQDPLPTVNYSLDATTKSVPVATSDNAAKVQQILAAQLDRSGLVTTTYSAAKTLYSPSVKTSVTSLYSSKAPTLPAQYTQEASTVPSDNKALLVGGLLVLLVVGGVTYYQMKKKA